MNYDSTTLHDFLFLQVLKKKTMISMKALDMTMIMVMTIIIKALIQIMIITMKREIETSMTMEFLMISTMMMITMVF